MFGVAAVAAHGFKILKNKYLWGYGLTFALVVSPLLLRNVVAYGNPFYHENIPLLELDRDDRSVVLRSVDRFFSGVVGQGVTFVSSLGLRGAGQSVWSPGVFFSGAAIFILAAVGVVRDSHRLRRLFTLLVFAAFWTFFAWYYVVGPGEVRFMLPLVPIAVVYGGLGLQSILHRVFIRWRQGVSFRRVALMPFLAAVVALAAIDVAVKRDRLWANPFHSILGSYASLVTWMEAHIGQGDGYLMTEEILFKPGWHSRLGVQHRVSGSPPSEFLEYIARNRVKYVIVYFPEGSPSHDSSALPAHFSFSASEGVLQKRPVPGWQLEFRDPSVPPRFLIYRVPNSWRSTGSEGRT
jgi:hypothetical protein